MAKKGIYIKPKNRGKFTRWAKKRNMSVGEATSKVLSNKDEYPGSVVKMANFSRNFGGNEDGGMVYAADGAGLMKAGNIVSSAAPLLNAIPVIGPIAGLAAGAVGKGLSLFGGKKAEEAEEKKLAEQEKLGKQMEMEMQSDQILASFDTEGNNQRYFGAKHGAHLNTSKMKRRKFYKKGGKRYIPYPYQDQPRTMINPTLKYQDGGDVDPSDVALSGGIRTAALAGPGERKRLTVVSKSPEGLDNISMTKSLPKYIGGMGPVMNEKRFERKTSQEVGQEMFDQLAPEISSEASGEANPKRKRTMLGSSGKVPLFGPKYWMNQNLGTEFELFERDPKPVYVKDKMEKGGNTSRSLYEIVTAGDTNKMWATQAYDSPSTIHANHPGNTYTHRDNVDYDTWKKQLATYAKGGSVPGGDLIPMGDDKVVVDGNNPRKTDDVQYRPDVMVDDGEVIQDKSGEPGERVFSDSKDMIIPGTGKTPAQLVKELEGQKRFLSQKEADRMGFKSGGKTDHPRYKSHNQRINKEIDKIFNIQQMMNGGSTGEPAMANGGGTDPKDPQAASIGAMKQYTSQFNKPDLGPVRLQDRGQGTDAAWRNLAPESNPYMSALGNPTTLDAAYQYMNTNPEEASALMQKVGDVRGGNPYSNWGQFVTTEIANPTLKAEIKRREAQAQAPSDIEIDIPIPELGKDYQPELSKPTPPEPLKNTRFSGAFEDGGMALVTQEPPKKKSSFRKKKGYGKRMYDTQSKGTSQEHSARRDTTDQGRTYKTGESKDPVRKVHYKKPKTEAPASPKTAMDRRFSWARKGRPRFK